MMHDSKSRIAFSSLSEISNVEFGPHPGEIIRSKRIAGAVAAPGLILKILEPGDQLFATLLRLGRSTRGDAAQHTDRLIEDLSVVLVQCDSHNLGLHVGWDFVRRVHRIRLARSHYLLD